MAASGGHDSIPEDQVQGRMKVNCELCLKKTITVSAKYFCTDCERCICGKCENGHRREKRYAKHKIVDIKNVKLDKYALRQKMSTENTKSGVTNDLKSINNEARVLKEFVTQSKGDMSKQCGDLLSSIKHMKLIMIEKFEQLEESMAKESTDIQNSHSQVLDTKYSTCDLLEMSTNQMLSTNRQGNPDDPTATQIQSFKTVLHQQQTDLHTLDFSIEFDPILTSLLQEGRALGRLHIGKRDDVNETRVKPVMFVLMMSVDVKQAEDDGKEPLYTGLTFLPGIRLVVVDCTNSKLYVMDERLEKLGEYKFDTYPYSVAVVSADQVAVTTGAAYKLLILNISKTNSIKLTKTMKVEAQYDSISPKNDTTFVASTIEDKRPVRMISMDGKESDITGLPDKQYQLDGSACTYIKKTGTLVFTDRFEHTVYMYELKDKYVTRRVVKDDNIREPRGACEGPDGTFFVCSQDTYMIVQLSPAGKVIGTCKLDMRYPLTVAMSLDGSKLAVSNCAPGNKKLKVFSIH